MRAFAFFSLLSLLACGGAQSSTEPRPPARPLDEARAMELVAEVLGEHQAVGVAHRSVHLGTVDFEVDVAVQDKPVGVEFLTDLDRQALGASLGRSSRADELRVIAADERGHGRMDVLFLHDRNYRYDPNPIESDTAAPTIQEVEGRFRRDLRDFFEHERTAGHL